jgi:hypothetical protein
VVEGFHSPGGEPKYELESIVRFFWLVTCLVHEFTHTFEWFLLWFNSDYSGSANAEIPIEFEPNSDEFDIGHRAEVELLGGCLGNTNDGSGRNDDLRI